MASEKETLISPVKLQQKFKTKKYKEDNEKRSERIEIRLTKKEHRELNNEAKTLKLTESQLVRDRIKYKPDLNPRIAINIVHIDDLLTKSENSQDDKTAILYEIKREFNELKDKIYECCIPKIERCKLQKEKKKAQKKERSKELEAV